MIDHLSSYTTHFPDARAFYQAALAEIGYAVQAEMALADDPDLPGRRMCAFGPSGRPVFWVIESLERASPRHVAFAAESRATVDAFHRAGQAAGGQDHGAPGLRPIYHEHYYASFLTDPDGNNVEAVCHSAAP
jgi:catechol 2,3-dioxygenase-like lactoylglutathione lyase family enzyme